VVGLLLLEPLRFGFITEPTKRCLPLQFISEAIAAVERVAELCRAAAFELSAPCSFHFRFGHPRSLMPSQTGPPVAFAASHVQFQQDVEINILHCLLILLWKAFVLTSDGCQFTVEVSNDGPARDE
jgi:hypothetical protein